MFFQICRHVLAAGHTLIYGGDPNLQGFVDALGDIEHAYRFGAEGDRRIINYVAHYLAADEDFNTAKLTDAMRVLPVPRVRPENEQKELRQLLDLTAMREHMNEQTDVRIVLGGKLLAGEVGTRRGPGVVEEAYLAATSPRRVPLLVAGGYGGAGAFVAALVAGGSPPDVDAVSAHYAPLEPLLTGAVRGATFREMVAAIGPEALVGNGLAPEENAALLRARDSDLIVSSIVLALHRLAHEEVSGD